MRLFIAGIIGGATGNLIDRFIHGGVIDFIEIHYNSFYYPVFNFADSVICICSLLLIFTSYKNRRKFR